ncbi:MAG TPA: SCO family protein [Longimicrobiales bacterium]
MRDRAKLTAMLLTGVALTITGLGAAMAVRLQGAGRIDALPVLWEAPDFALTDQTGDTLTRADLAGTTWLASFIYTNCPDFCPLVSRRMAELRDELAAEDLLGSRVRLVSITVDPARDTPAALHDYAARFGGADPADWAFLTGEPAVVRAVVESGFRVPASPQAEAAASAHEHGAAAADGYTVLHSDRIILVDAAGRVRGFYSATDPAELERLRAELRFVLRSGPDRMPGSTPT